MRTTEKPFRYSREEQNDIDTRWLAVVCDSIPCGECPVGRKRCFADSGYYWTVKALEVEGWTE